MQTIGRLRHQTIAGLMSKQTDMTVDALIALWDLVAVQIILIVGEAGFDSLYARSVSLSQSTLPWLPTDSTIAQVGHRFANLKVSFQAQPRALAQEANALLLVTFTDILASLMGETLTATILHTAWDSQVQGNDGQEEINEP